MSQKRLQRMLDAAQQYFHKTTSVLEEGDSAFAPVPGMRTVAQSVAHTAHVVDWFVEGAFRPEGLDLDFEAHERKVLAVTSLGEAREWLDKAFDRARDVLAAKSEEELAEPIAGQIFGGQPRKSLVGGIVDHTAHHRGSLAVYARLLGKAPPMPYL